MKRNRWGAVCVNSCCLALLGTASVGAEVPKLPRAALRLLAALPGVPQDVGERVRRIVSEVLGMPMEKVTPEAHFVHDLGADSLDAVELVLAVEKEFGITIPDQDAAKLQTVGQVIDYIQSRLG